MKNQSDKLKSEDKTKEYRNALYQKDNHISVLENKMKQL